MTARKPVAEIAAEMGIGLESPHITCEGAAARNPRGNGSGGTCRHGADAPSVKEQEQ